MLKKFNKWFFITIVVIALIPAIPGILIMLGPVGVLVLCVFGLVGFSRFRQFVFGLFGNLIKLIAEILSWPFQLSVWLLGKVFYGLFSGLGWLFNLGDEPIRFMGWFERAKLLSSSNQGFLMNGRSARLSEAASYQGMMIFGGTGRGKSSVYPIPNLLNPPATRPSFVITDPSGEIFEKTSGYLSSQGYDIQTLDLDNPYYSHGYNPMLGLSDETSVAQFASTIVRAANAQHSGHNHDPFWEQSAEKLIRILTQCLINQPDTRFRNLANLRYLITSFDAHVAPPNKLGKIDEFVMRTTTNDPLTFNSYEAFIRGNLKTIQSVLMSADVALDAVATPQIGALTSQAELDIAALRQQPTALYLIVNQNQMAHYSFLLNLFYAELFRVLLQDHNAQGLPVHLWLDEGGHFQVDQLAIVMTTARKYCVAIALLLQSVSQLEVQYGRDKTAVLLENVGTEVHFPGMSVATAADLENRLGRKDNKPLMSAAEIARMDSDEVLLLHSNRLPLIDKIYPYYQQSRLNSRSQIKPFNRSLQNRSAPNFIPLV